MKEKVIKFQTHPLKCLVMTTISAFILASKICLAFTFTSTPDSPSSSDKPQTVEINAQNFIKWVQSENKLEASGQAKAFQRDSTLHADNLSAYFSEKNDIRELKLIKGDGNVHIENGEKHAYGQHLNYDVNTGKMDLTQGNLKLVSAQTIITADKKLEYDENKQIAKAHGHATATKDNNKIESDLLVAYLNLNETDQDKQIKKIEAFGHVIITTPGDIIHSEQATYDPISEIAYATGKVQIFHQGQHQIIGHKAEINLKTGQSKMLDAGQTNTGKKSNIDRVHGVIVPSKRSPTKIE